ncbi:MAG TPA: TetR/AcrR family transcriptional regulator [Acidimicrobiia bacterium]|nr:TetR/AcrR family transcriptional regulator [Acidimicrobiia bacterium]
MVQGPVRPPGVVARRADEIVDIASRLFYERGYQSVSTRALAQAAGIQGGSLYHHFASKEEILYRIVQYGSGEFFAGLLPHLEGGHAVQPGGSPGPPGYPERLDRFVRAYVTDAQPRRYAIAVLFRDMAHLSPDHFVELQAVRRHFQQAVQRFLAAGLAAGEFAVPDAKLAGIAILDLLKGVDAWMREPGRLSRRQVADTYAALILQLMGAPPR